MNRFVQVGGSAPVSVPAYNSTRSRCTLDTGERERPVPLADAMQPYDAVAEAVARRCGETRLRGIPGARRRHRRVVSGSAQNTLIELRVLRGRRGSIVSAYAISVDARWRFDPGGEWTWSSRGQTPLVTTCASTGAFAGIRTPCVHRVRYRRRPITRDRHDKVLAVSDPGGQGRWLIAGQLVTAISLRPCIPPAVSDPRIRPHNPNRCQIVVVGPPRSAWRTAPARLPRGALRIGRSPRRGRSGAHRRAVVAARSHGGSSVDLGAACRSPRDTQYCRQDRHDAGTIMVMPRAAQASTKSVASGCRSTA